MEDEIKVSIIIPVYNAEKYLKELISSLLKQTMPELEFIFVNDGSTDGAQVLLERYTQIDSRFVLINKKNEGVSIARNMGMQRARGKYIGFMDSDDFAADNMYEVLYNKAKETDADIVSCGYISYQRGYSISCLNDTNTELSQIEAVRGLLDNRFLGMSVCNKLFKKECLKEVYFDKRYKINEDRLFIFLAIQNAMKVAIISDTLYYYRLNMDSASHIQFTHTRMDALYVAEEIHAISIEKYPYLINEANANIARSAYAVLLLMYKDCVVKKFKTEHRILISEIKKTKLLAIRTQLGMSRFLQLLMVKYCESAYRVIKSWDLAAKERKKEYNV